MLYFAWCDKDADFDENVHLCHDVTLLSVDISHNEGERALLKLKTSHFHYPKSFFCFLSYKKDEKSKAKLLFKGELCHFPLKSQNNIWEIDFRAIIQAKSLGDFLKDSGSRSVSADDFYELAKDHEITKKLHHENALFEFDRCTGEVSKCGLFEGNETLESEKIFKKSVNVCFTELPYEGVCLKIAANWRQVDEGEVDVAPVLAGAFPEKMMNTLTKRSFEKTFPKVGMRLGDRKGRSACRIVESTLTKIDPPHTGLLDVYSTTTPPLWQRDVEDEGPHQVVFERHWYTSTLMVEWRYRQKRREIVHLFFKNCVQAPHLRPTKMLTLTLKDLPDSPCSSFFKTQKGADTLRFAVEYAQCFLAASARCVEVSFKIPFEEGVNLSTDKVFDLKNLFKVKTPILGKITHYRLIKKGGRGYAFVRCAFSIGMKNEGVERKECAYSEGVYVDDGITSDIDQGMIDEAVKGLKIRGIADTRILHTQALVEKVSVVNDGRTQVIKLQNAQCPRIGNLGDVLKNNPTTFSLLLKDLRTENLLEETITLQNRLFLPKHVVDIKEVFYAI